MSDLRDKVQEDRGLIKKIELAIPGFRGYREREDLRAADNMLRSQLADRLGEAKDQMERCRKILSKQMDLDLLEDVGGIINNIQMTESKLRHAEQGYSGISADFRIEGEELNRLYEWDLGLIDNIDRILKQVTSLQDIISGKEKKQTLTSLGDIRSAIDNFNSLFSKRVETIQNAVAV
ncbi:MAG: hypothetical protein SVM80_12405 [Halobacteriota archaeon]|nr:hypothetical protein [Halobacteriota archaeon]